MAHGGEEPRLGSVGRLRGATCLIESLLSKLAIGDVAHHGDDVDLAHEFPVKILLVKILATRIQLEWPAAHLDPDKVDLTALRSGLFLAQPEFDAANVAARSVR
ncbi:hypothetical protein ACVWXO_010112 [Bradyrhizobium sp. LM2.7]